MNDNAIIIAKNERVHRIMERYDHGAEAAHYDGLRRLQRDRERKVRQLAESPNWGRSASSPAALRHRPECAVDNTQSDFEPAAPAPFILSFPNEAVDSCARL